MPSIPREKYPEMNWRAADKVATWKVFKRRMEVIFVADQIPEERQWALILVAGGDEACNRWDTLEDTVKDRKVVKEVWDAFEKSFEQSTSFWHFRDTYLADFRQDESETMADLDLRIKQTVRGCQRQRESEEERMIDLLYHATIYYEIHKFVQESDPTALTYEMVIEKAKAHERNVLEYKDHQASHGGANSTPTIIYCYLLTHYLKDGPVAMVTMANIVANVANLMSGVTALHMEKLAIGAKASIISKPFVVPRLQPRRHRALTEARSHSHLDVVPWGATMARAKEVATVNTRRRRPQRSRRSRMRMQ